MTLADAPSARGGSWAEDGTIVFAPGSASERPVARAGGGRDGRAADDAGPRGSDAPVAAGAARRPGRPLHGEHRDRQLHERLARGAAAARRDAAYRAARRLLRPLSPQRAWLAEARRARRRPSDLGARRDALCRAVRSRHARRHRPGRAGGARRGEQYQQRQRAGGGVAHRHARVPPGRRDRVGGPARLADPRRQDDAAQSHAGQLERRADRPGRPPAGLLAHGRGEHGRVDVRCGARRADAG